MTLKRIGGSTRVSRALPVRIDRHWTIRMMRSCLILILAFATAGSAKAQSDSGTRATILALEKLWYECFATKDTRAIDSILDNSVLLVNFDGTTQTKGDYLTSLKIAFAQTENQESQTLPESMIVKVFGTTAIATGVYRIKGIRNGKPYERRDRFVDTWKYRGGLWLIVGTQATPVLN
jgi:ketosteroid isomerase-like protein